MSFRYRMFDRMRERLAFPFLDLSDLFSALTNLSRAGSIAARYDFLVGMVCFFVQDSKDFSSFHSSLTKKKISHSKLDLCYRACFFTPAGQNTRLP